MRQYTFQPCIPAQRVKVPAGPDWLHEIKSDGYRLIVQREGKRVRVLTRRGYDWSDPYPLITAAALRLRQTAFVSTAIAPIARGGQRIGSRRKIRSGLRR